MTAFWRKAIVPSTASVRDAMQAIGDSRHHICIVTGDGDRLLGTVTDGDIRRAILQSVPVEAPVEQIMTRSPISAPHRTPKKALKVTMMTHSIREIPLVDESGAVVGIHSLTLRPEEIPACENWVVLMAGGRGKRLRPFTDDTPKPMIEVGHQPVLETIIGQVMEHGFHRFMISINYMAEAITDYFGDGSDFGAEIQYLREDAPLGTAGSLSLIDQPMEQPLLVINGDVLNTINFSSLLDFHKEQGATATMCVRDSEFQVPFGIVSIEDGLVTGIEEKPTQRHFVNAGIYALDPRALDKVPAGRPFDMPELFNALIADDQKVAAFPVGEYWADIGRPEDLEKAQQDFAKAFGN